MRKHLNYDAVVSHHANYFTQQIEGKTPASINQIDSTENDTTTIRVDGIDSSLYDAVVSLLNHHGIDESVFINKLLSDSVKTLTQMPEVYKLQAQSRNTDAGVSINAIRGNY